MAKLSTEPDSKSLDDNLVPFIKELTVTTQPVVVCGVQRKANIGNYENIDIYCAVALPANVIDDGHVDGDTLTQKLVELASQGFAFASEQTLSRYEMASQVARGRKSG